MEGYGIALVLWLLLVVNTVSLVVLLGISLDKSIFQKKPTVLTERPSRKERKENDLRRKSAKQCAITRSEILQYGLYGVKPNGKTQKTK